MAFLSGHESKREPLLESRGERSSTSEGEQLEKEPRTKQSSGFIDLARGRGLHTSVDVRQRGSAFF